MQVGIDSFAAAYDEAGLAASPATRVDELIRQIERADQVGLDTFGVGEHHRKEYLDSAAHMILAGAATRTNKIRLTSAVTVLSAIDPVRAFQNFATLDLLSNGRAEIIAGRGSFIDAYPLFGHRLEDYDSLFAENLDLLLKLRTSEHITWSGKHRAPLNGQGIYPRPIQNPLPVWVGIGGSPESAARAGALGLPLMVAIIGGETRRFRPVIDLYRAAGKKFGHPPETLKVGVHSIGYVAEDAKLAADEFYPGLKRAMGTVAAERGWSEMTRRQFDAQLGPYGAYLIGDPETVAAKILRHARDLGGIDRITFQMNAGSLPHEKMVRAIDLIGKQVAPAVRDALATKPAGAAP